MILASAQRMLGNTEAALREAEGAGRAYKKAKSDSGVARAHLAAAETAWEGRRVEEARKWLEQGIAAARQSGDDGLLGQLLSLSATVANLRGDYDTAKGTSKKSIVSPARARSLPRIRSRAAEG